MLSGVASNILIVLLGLAVLIGLVAWIYGEMKDEGRPFHDDWEDRS